MTKEPNLFSSDHNDGDITELLKCWHRGDDEAMQILASLVYDQLESRARFFLKKERRNHPYTSADLINETFLNLLMERKRKWQNSGHFFGVASRIMRHILARYANTMNTSKRGGKITHVSLERTTELIYPIKRDTTPLKEALAALAKRDPRKKITVELAFVAGMTADEISHTLGVSISTVKRDLRFSKQWLQSHFQRFPLPAAC